MNWQALRKVRVLFAALGAGLVVPLGLALSHSTSSTQRARDPSCETLCPNGVRDLQTCKTEDVTALQAEVDAKGCRGCQVRQITGRGGQVFCS